MCWPCRDVSSWRMEPLHGTGCKLPLMLSMFLVFGTKASLQMPQKSRGVCIFFKESWVVENSLSLSYGEPNSSGLY